MKQAAGMKRRPLMVKKFDTMLLGGTLTMMVVSVLLMSDSVIAGIFLGSDAVEGVNLVTPIYSVSAFFGSVFSLGVPIRYSLNMGEFNKKEANRIFGTGLLMSVVAGIALFLFASLFGGAFIKSCHPSEEALGQALGYLKWMRFTVLFLPLDMLMAEMVYNDGDTGITVLANCVQGFGNVAASLILSRIMGISGIALASCLFTFLSLAVLFIHLLKKNNSLKLNFYFSFDILKSVVRYSAIDASTYLWLGAGNAALNWFVCTRFGAEYLILVSVITFCREFQLVFDGIGEAITPIVSVYLGEDCFPGVRMICRRARNCAVLEGIIITVLMFITAPLVPSLLGITGAGLAGLAVTGLRTVSLGSVFVSLLYLSTSYYLLIDRIGLGLCISALRDVIVTAPAAVLLGLLFGINGMFAGFAAASLIAWLASLLLLRFRYGADAPLLLGDREREKDALLYCFDAVTDSVMSTRDTLAGDLQERGFDGRTVNRAMLFFEELFMLICEKNPGVRVQAECTVIIEGEKIRMITRDTGAKLDLADPDMEIDSLRSYVISNLTSRISLQKQHLVTMSFNRNMIEFEGKRD